MQYMTDDEYNKLRDTHYTSTHIKNIIRYGYNYADVLKRETSQPTPSMLLGREIHRMILTPDEEETKLTPAMKKKRDGILYNMENIREYAHLHRLLEFYSEREQVHTFKFAGQDCAVKFDAVNTKSMKFLELKTTSSLDSFKYDFYKFNYDTQLAFYSLAMQDFEANNPIKDASPNPFLPETCSMCEKRHIMHDLVVIETSLPYRVRYYSLESSCLKNVATIEKVLYGDYEILNTFFTVE